MVQAVKVRVTDSACCQMIPLVRTNLTQYACCLLIVRPFADGCVPRNGTVGAVDEQGSPYAAGSKHHVRCDCIDDHRGLALVA